MPPHALSIPLVLLPGLDGTGLLGRSLVARFAAAKLVTYPPDRVSSFEELVAHVRAAIESQPRVILVGESYSSAIALRYAAAYPQQVAAVVLIAGFIAPPWTRALAPAMWAWLFRIRPPRWIVRWAFAGAGADDERVDHVIATVRSVKPHVISGRLRQVLTTDHTPVVRGLGAPVLYVAGESDRLVRRDSIRRVQEALPQTKVVYIPGPHVLSETHPDEVADAIREFVAGISGVP